MSEAIILIEIIQKGFHASKVVLYTLVKMAKITFKLLNGSVVVIASGKPVSGGFSF